MRILLPRIYHLHFLFLIATLCMAPLSDQCHLLHLQQSMRENSYDFNRQRRCSRLAGCVKGINLWHHNGFAVAAGCLNLNHWSPVLGVCIWVRAAESTGDQSRRHQQLITITLYFNHPNQQCSEISKKYCSFIFVVWSLIFSTMFDWIRLNCSDETEWITSQQYFTTFIKCKSIAFYEMEFVINIFLTRSNLHQHLLIIC